MIRRLSSVASWVLFSVAFVLAGIAVVEKVVNPFGFTLTVPGGFLPARLLELAVVALIFVIALQLREIKHLSRDGPRRRSDPGP